MVLVALVRTSFLLEPVRYGTGPRAAHTNTQNTVVIVWWRLIVVPSIAYEPRYKLVKRETFREQNTIFLFGRSFLSLLMEIVPNFDFLKGAI